MRIPVNQEGERVFDFHANVLTVIANESYDLYARKLQTEYRDAGYDKMPPPPTRVGKATVHRNQVIYQNPDFQEFWAQLCQQSNYHINIHTEQLVNDCILSFNTLDLNKLKPKVVVQTGRFIITRFTITLLQTFDDGTAQVQVKIDSSERQSLFDTFQIHVSKNDKLSDRINKDQRLRGFRIKEIYHSGEESFVLFDNDIKLFLGESTTFESQTGGEQIQQTVSEVQQTWPVFNVIDRVANATGITRKTINQIFQEIDEPHLKCLFTNPEGFTNLLIQTIKEELSDHIVEHIEFEFCVGKRDFPLEDFFPPECEFAQHELIEAGDVSIYDKVQTDSEVEKRFVKNSLSGNDPKVIAYFKFPTRFKVELPKILGNYNPDWGILREGEHGNVILKLVRETKGQEDIDKLRFSHEGRKVRAAQKHFDAINVDYRMITDTTPFWWRPKKDVFGQDPII